MRSHTPPPPGPRLKVNWGKSWGGGGKLASYKRRRATRKIGKNLRKGGPRLKEGPSTRGEGWPMENHPHGGCGFTTYRRLPTLKGGGHTTFRKNSKSLLQGRSLQPFGRKLFKINTVISTILEKNQHFSRAPKPICANCGIFLARCYKSRGRLALEAFRKRAGNLRKD